MQTKLETKTCSRCGGSGKMPFAVYGGVCFKCNGAGNFYTKRGRAAHAFLERLRSRTLEQIEAGMLVLYRGFSCGSITVPTKFEKVTSIVGPKVCGQRRSKDTDPWENVIGFDINTNGTSFGGVQAGSLHRMGHTGVGKKATFALALDYQNKLTVNGKFKKGEAEWTAEGILATNDTTGWLVREDAPVTLAVPCDQWGNELDRHGRKVQRAPRTSQDAPRIVATPQEALAQATEALRTGRGGYVSLGVPQ
jgi:hypothetical protein